jgi:hypothetical protein
MVVFLFLLDRAEPRGCERRHPEQHVQALQRGNPGGHRPVAHLEIFPKAVDRQGRADQLRQAHHEQLEVPQVLNPFEGGHVFANEAGAVLARPSPRLHLAAAQVGLGEPPERQEVGQLLPGSQRQFGGRERVEAEEMVAALQRIASEPVQVQAPAARHQDALPGPAAVVDALEVVPPPPVLVDFVEHPEASARQAPPQDPFAVLRDVPVQVPGAAAGKREREGGLADLARPRHEDHLARQVLGDLRREVARLHRHA